MAETLGQLVDRLSIVNIKLWHVQDVVYAAVAAGEGLDAETTAKLAALNLERNRFVTEIDEAFDQAVRSGSAPISANIKLVKP